MNDIPWARSPEFREYAESALREMLPKLSESEFTVSIAPRPDKDDPKGIGDVKYWVELGASIMLDKPILVLIEPGQQLPERLERVADLIVRADMRDPIQAQRAAEQIAVFAERHRP